MLTTNEVARVYDTRASSYHSFINFVRYPQGLKSLLLEHVDIPSGSHVLDVGCGSGMFMRQAHELCKADDKDPAKWDAFDLSVEMLQRLKFWIEWNHHQNIRIMQHDILSNESLPDDWNWYSLILSSGAPEYIPKNRLCHVLVRLRRVLNQGGTLLVVMSRKNLMNKVLIRRWWSANLYDEGELVDIFFQAGFEQAKIVRFPSPKLLGFWCLSW